MIDRLFMEQLQFTAVEMDFGITHNPQDCKCEVCQARTLLSFGHLPGVNPACALAYLLEPTDLSHFLKGVFDNPSCQCNIYTEN